MSDAASRLEAGGLFDEPDTGRGRGALFRWSASRLVLILLTIEKVVQHLFVTYAFAVDLGDIRASVVLHHVPLMVVGFGIGLLFAVSAGLQYKNQRAGYRLLFGLALFDVVAEFVAQGTLAIDIVVSIIVAAIIILVLFFNRQELLGAGRR